MEGSKARGVGWIRSINLRLTGQELLHPLQIPLPTSLTQLMTQGRHCILRESTRNLHEVGKEMQSVPLESAGPNDTFKLKCRM